MRFRAPERWLHWAMVLPYLVLGTTGLLLLIREVLGWSRAARGVLVIVHLAAGGALAALPLLVLMRSRQGSSFPSLREAWRWRPAELAWLLRSALRLLFPRVRLPRAGRFNAGQRLNLLHVVLLVPLVAATGVACWLVPAAILLRAAHAGAALASLVIAAGHMYLALVNPSTRVALGAMFHGRVTRAYAEHHHPAWFEALTGQRAAEPPPGARRVSQLAVVAPVLLGATCLVLLYAPAREGAHAILASALGPLREEPLRAISPAPLSAIHAAEKELGRCTGCHDLSGVVSSARCMACHAPIAQRLQERTGYHGSLQGECASCHADHQATLIALEDRSFNHEQATFRLRGKHAGVACDSCHRPAGQARRRYVGIEPASGCASCHPDPHAPPLERPCEHCHAEASWGALAASFRHDSDTSFPLLGAHAAAQCDACHARECRGPPRLRGTAAECGACHEDPHSRPDVTCSSCHRDASRWSATGFDHGSMARFALDPLHRDLGCGSCHRDDRPLRFRFGPEDGREAAVAFSCAGCHRDIAAAQRGEIAGRRVVASPHEGKVACAECHKPTGARDALPCSGCHPADYDLLAAEWYGRIEIDRLRLGSGPAVPAARDVRPLASHNWEGTAQWLRAMPSRGEGEGSSR